MQGGSDGEEIDTATDIAGELEDWLEDEQITADLNNCENGWLKAELDGGAYIIYTVCHERLGVTIPEGVALPE